MFSIDKPSSTPNILHNFDLFHVVQQEFGHFSRDFLKNFQFISLVFSIHRKDLFSFGVAWPGSLSGDRALPDGRLSLFKFCVTKK